MSDDDATLAGDVSDMPTKVEVLCGEARGNDLCREGVGLVKRTEVGMLFAPRQGPTFYLGEWRLPHAPNEAVPRAKCPDHGWVTVDEGVLLKAGEKPGTPTVWAHLLPPR